MKSILLFLALCVSPFSALLAGTDWNDDGITWVDYAAALELARSEKKPIMLVLHSEGCGACREYSALFHKPEVIEAASSIIMVVVDDGIDEALSDKFSPDGSYVPRTFFLSCKGKQLDIALGKADSRFQYYYESRKPEGLVEKMQLAKQAAC